MPVFTKSKKDEELIKNLIDKTNKTISLLEPYSDCCNITEIQKIKDEFIKTTEDFFSKERKLNIGVIGQVKAGKSTFLNTLLFDGKKVLPSAATPKTATLTKIEYGKENTLLIEYYDSDEWNQVIENAKSESCSSEYEAAREIVKLAEEKGIDPAEYISRKKDEFRFNSSDELMNRLDDYVGEGGKYTAVVKNVTIKLDREELKDISVVDTPGLNDTIASRTDKTRQFLSMCDVVFFLSRASQVLDSSDMKLITTQLPQKGAEKLVFICSRFDDGLADTLYDYDSIEETLISTKAKLKQRAVNVIDGYISKNPIFENTISSCENPVFISSICWNMHNKSEDEYDNAENVIVDILNEHDDLNSAVLREIGNIDTVRREFDKVVAEKDETLSQRAKNFIPKYEARLTKALEDIRTYTKKKADMLNTNDKSELDNKKKYMSAQINSIKSSVESVFGETLTRLETAKISTVRQLRDAKADAAKLPDKTGTETHVSSYRVSDSKLFKPSTWGTSHMEFSTYQTEYKYVDVSDSLENIRNFSYEACSSIEQTISSSADLAGTKFRLLNKIIENIDTSDDRYDPALFRMITEQTLNSFEQPILKLDVRDKVEAISSKFIGEVRDSGERSKLRELLSHKLEELLETVMHIFEKEVMAFHNNIKSMKTEFSQKMIENIENEFNELLVQVENKEREIRKYEELLVCIDMVSKQI